MVRMLVVTAIRLRVRELHRQPERERVFRAHLPQSLEPLDTGYCREPARGGEKVLLRSGAGGVPQAEDDGVTNHNITNWCLDYGSRSQSRVMRRMRCRLSAPTLLSPAQ